MTKIIISKPQRKFTRDEMVSCASSMKRCWNRHSEMLSSDPLTYIDVLIDTIWDIKSATTWQVSAEIRRLAPRLLPGTIDRLINLKVAQRKHLNPVPSF